MASLLLVRCAMLARVVTAALLGALVACGQDAGDPDPAPPTGRSQQAIIRGEASSADEDAVVALHIRLTGSTGLCSGTLVAPNLLVTAAHCIAVYPGGDASCELRGKPDGVGSHVTSLIDAADVSVFVGAASTTVAAAKGQTILVPPELDTCLHDIAYIVLDREIPNAKIAPLRLEAPPVAGEKVTLLGYGMSERDEGGRTRLRRGDVELLALGPATLPLSKPLAAPINHVVIQEGICWGDSGGPMLDASGAIVGVASKLRSEALLASPTTTVANCIEGESAYVFGLHTRVDAFRELAREAFAVAGRTPGVEGSNPPAYASHAARCTPAADCARAPTSEEPAAADATAPTSCAVTRRAHPDLLSALAIACLAVALGARRRGR